MTAVYDLWQAALRVGVVLESGTKIGLRLSLIRSIGEKEENKTPSKKKRRISI